MAPSEEEKEVADDPHAIATNGGMEGCRQRLCPTLKHLRLYRSCLAEMTPEKIVPPTEGIFLNPKSSSEGSLRCQVAAQRCGQPATEPRSTHEYLGRFVRGNQLLLPTFAVQQHGCTGP